MLRLLNILALTVLVGTAGWAYQTKYETIRYAEEVRKLEHKIEKERDQIAVLKAEWQLLNRPARLEALAVKLDMRPLRPTQIARIEDLPVRGKEVDHIGVKLDALLTGSIPTPGAPKAGAGKTPVKIAPSAKTPSKTPLAKAALGRNSAKAAPVKAAATTPATRPTAAAAPRPPLNLNAPQPKSNAAAKR